MRQEFLDGPRLRASRLLGVRLRRNRPEEGAQCSCEECRRIIPSPVWEKPDGYSDVARVPAAESVSHLPFTILWYYCLHKYLERSP